LSPTLLNKQPGQVPAGMFPGESANPRDPFVSPCRRPGPVALAVTQARSGKTLLEDSQPFADRARQAGAGVRADLFPDSTHLPLAVSRSKDAAEAMRGRPGPPEAGPVSTRSTTREREQQCAN
jgi:acetyl esterase/lipase